MKRLLSVIYLLVGLCTLLTAQRPVELHYTHTDGLFTNEVINLMLDSEGRLWLSYSMFDRFSRFDGLKWEHWDLMEEGVSGNYRLFAGDKEGLWFRGDGADRYFLLGYSDEKGWRKYKTEGLIHVFNNELQQIQLINPQSGDLYWFDPKKPKFKRPADYNFRTPIPT